MSERAQPVSSIEGFVGAILRGAAKILGCNSANLIVFNTKTGEIRVRVGTLAPRNAKLASVERIFGNTIHRSVFAMRKVEDSLVYAAWRDRAIYETSSFIEMVGSAFPRILGEKVDGLIGELRYICVPVVRPSGILGVMIFTKEDVQPFGRQQREVLLQYAQRVGEIIENEARSRGSELTLEPSASSLCPPQALLLFAADGALLGWSPSLPVAEPGTGDLVRAMADAAAKLASSDDERREVGPLPVSSIAALLGTDLRSQVWAELTLMRMGDARAVLCSLVDRRARSEQSIQAQLVHFALGETAPAVLVDPKFQITSCNDATEQLTGFEGAQLVGKPVETLFCDVKDIHTILNHQFLFFSHGYFEDATVVRRRDGSVFPARIKALLLAGEENEVIGFLVLIHDESQRKAAAGHSKDGEQQLMRKERLATMGEMAAALAHEIRNPLVSIGATLETLGRDTENLGEAAAVLAVLAREVTRIDTILQDYLSLSVRRNTTAARVDLRELVADACRLVGGQGGHGGPAVDAQVDGGIEVFADYAGLRQVLVNLLRNAVEAAPAGSAVTCRVAVGEEHVEIGIEDLGRGLAVTEEECFQPFFTTKQNGTGLGLTVCQKIVEAHGGSVSLENRAQGGCRASVTLPRRLAKR
ncbi:MAG: ATP-binding protein [Deltaproteobacteria bacterium]|nr:ATP-binding protein [Deltaproteobacteria bacterium]